MTAGSGRSTTASASTPSRSCAPYCGTTPAAHCAPTSSTTCAPCASAGSMATRSPRCWRRCSRPTSCAPCAGGSTDWSRPASTPTPGRGATCPGRRCDALLRRRDPRFLLQAFLAQQRLHLDLSLLKSGGALDCEIAVGGQRDAQFGLDAAGVGCEHVNPLAEEHRLGDVMRHHQNGDLCLAPDAQQKL